jgi:hypothetical protein
MASVPEEAMRAKPVAAMISLAQVGASIPTSEIRHLAMPLAKAKVIGLFAD